MELLHTRQLGCAPTSTFIGSFVSHTRNRTLIPSPLSFSLSPPLPVRKGLLLLLLLSSVLRGLTYHTRRESEKPKSDSETESSSPPPPGEREAGTGLSQGGQSKGRTSERDKIRRTCLFSGVQFLVCCRPSRSFVKSFFWTADHGRCT